MAKLKRTMECGCIIGFDYDNTLTVLYCPKHKAAPELYEACRAYINWLDRRPGYLSLNQLDSLHRKALAKAVG